MASPPAQTCRREVGLWWPRMREGRGMENGAAETGPGQSPLAVYGARAWGSAGCERTECWSPSAAAFGCHSFGGRGPCRGRRWRRSGQTSTARPVTRWTCPTTRGQAPSRPAAAARGRSRASVGFDGPVTARSECRAASERSVRNAGSMLSNAVGKSDPSSSAHLHHDVWQLRVLAKDGIVPPATDSLR